MMKRFFVLPFVLIGIYFGLFRRWHMHWGATREEFTRPLPGDDLVPRPKIHATHAIQIQAAPSEIWPWLLQLGQGRGGFYSYTWIENLMGLDIHNSDHILPEYQSLNVGDLIHMGRGDLGIPVAVIQPARALVLHGDSRSEGVFDGLPIKEDEYLNTSWTFVLDPQEDGSTRLIERTRLDWSGGLETDLFYRLFLEPGTFFMEQAMLRGIKRRVETLHPQPVEQLTTA